MKNKSFLIALLLAISCITCIYYFGANACKLSKAEDFFTRGNYSSCEELLLSINPKKLAAPYSLYKGYLLLAQNQLEEAEILFNQTLLTSSCSPLLQLENRIASALCCYAQHDLESAEAALFQVDDYLKSHPWYKFVQGLLSFEKGDFSQVVACWKELDYSSLQRNPLATTWGPQLFKHKYPIEQFEITLARALIEVNDFTPARELLEKQQLISSSSLIQNLAYLYQGLICLKEAEYHPIKERLSYYKLASFYFDRTSPSSLDQKEIMSIASLLIQKMRNGFETDPHPESLVYLILPLQKWQLQDSLEIAAQNVVEFLTIINKEKSTALAATLQRYLEGSPFHQKVVDKATQLIIENIPEGQTELFQHYFSLILHLVKDPFQFQQKLLTHMMTNLDQVIAQDDEQFSQLKIYLDLFNTLDKGPETKSKTQIKSHLALKLLGLSKLFWQEEGKEGKATQLMQLSLTITPNKMETQKGIEEHLHMLFEQAEASNLIGRLSYIYDALVLFNIKTTTVLHLSTLENHLADAQYRFSSGHFASSQTLSSWVLKLDPKNQEALKLFGITSYYLGDYQQAILALNQLYTLDEDSQRVLVLSEVFISPDHTHLAQIDTLDSFQEDH